jgi:hypothetical protein
MRLVIYGAGWFKTVLGAYIMKSGKKIDLVNHNLAHIEALRARGTTIQGAADLMSVVLGCTFGRSADNRHARESFR